MIYMGGGATQPQIWFIIGKREYRSKLRAPFFPPSKFEFFLLKLGVRGTPLRVSDTAEVAGPAAPAQNANLRGVENPKIVRIYGVPLTPNSAKKIKFLVAFVRPRLLTTNNTPSHTPQPPILAKNLLDVLSGGGAQYMEKLQNSVEQHPEISILCG